MPKPKTSASLSEVSPRGSRIGGAADQMCWPSRGPCHAPRLLSGTDTSCQPGPQGRPKIPHPWPALRCVAEMPPPSFRWRLLHALHAASTGLHPGSNSSPSPSKAAAGGHPGRQQPRRRVVRNIPAATPPAPGRPGTRATAGKPGRNHRRSKGCTPGHGLS